MKKTKIRLLSGALSAAMLISSLTFYQVPVYAASMTAGGWYETIYADITGVKDADVTAVSYTGAMSGSLKGDDFTYLVRDGENGVRIDIPGLKAGNYTLKVTAGGTDYTQNVTVKGYDRSGYAHFNYTKGVGAYNDDGTLKANAKVLYVTDENKDTVTVSSKDNTTVTGIGNILNSRGGRVNKDKKGKVVSEVVNTNSDIILKLAQDGTPLAVRFIGDVTAPKGLTAYDSYDYGGTVGDNGFMARMISGNEITLEGIGYDAKIDGWGLHYICESAHTEYGKSFEVRNLDFYGSPEDSIGMEGQQSGSEITAGVERCWIHNNSFEPQKQAQYAESDKSEGDGCCDFKRGEYMTMSYNYFKNAHKTCLVGSSDSSMQFNITWHHNWFDHNESRAPLGRQANMHLYNNYFLFQSSKTMDTRANCFIFSEYNQLEYCKNPMTIKSSAIKSYKDTLVSCIEGEQSTVVTDKKTSVSSSNKNAGFELSSTMSYIPQNDYILQTSTADAKAECIANAGVMKKTPVDADDVTSSLAADKAPANAIVLPFSADYANGGQNAPTKTGESTTANVYYNATKLNADSISIGAATGGQFIVFKLDKKAKLTMTEISATGRPVLYDEYGKDYIVGSGSAVVPAGVYFIQPDTIDMKSGKFKEAKVASLKAEEVSADTALSGSARENSEDIVVVTVVKGDVTDDGIFNREDPEELLRYISGLAVSENFDIDNADYNDDEEVNMLDVIAMCKKLGIDSQSGSGSGSGSGESGGGTVAEGTQILTFDGGKATGATSFFTVSGKTSKDKGTVTYNGTTYEYCLKIESSTSVKFNTATAGTLTLVFGSGETGDILINDAVKKSNTNVLTENLSAGTYELKKDGVRNVFYIAFTPTNE